MKIRRRARAIALQTLYEVDSTGHNPKTVFSQRLAEKPLPQEGNDFAYKLVRGVLENLAELDGVVRWIAPEWPPDQIAVIDRNILRIAIFEIAIDKETPVKVAINEAVELAKLFGSESSRRFINGALGTLVSKRHDLAEGAHPKIRGSSVKAGQST